MCEQPKININRGLEESIIQFLVALWQRAMQQAQKQSTSDVEQRAEVIHKNILKINGFPIGELDLAGVEQAVRLGGDSQPQTAGQEKAYSCRCMRGNHSESCNNARNLRAAEIVDLSSLSSAHRERIEEFALRFVELSESGHLEAIAASACRTTTLASTRVASPRLIPCAGVRRSSGRSRARTTT